MIERVKLRPSVVSLSQATENVPGDEACLSSFWEIVQKFSMETPEAKLRRATLRRLKEV